jgi:hypothetical protein
VNSGGLHPDEHLVLAGFRRLHIGKLQFLCGSELLLDDRLHARAPSVGVVSDSICLPAADIHDGLISSHGRNRRTSTKVEVKVRSGVGFFWSWILFVGLGPKER